MAKTNKKTQGTILIIEKDVHIAYLMDYMLSREGFKVISTTNCEIACKLLQKMAMPDVIFLDLGLSLENDYAFLARVRQLPKWHEIPVLLLAEHSTMEDVDSALKAGATDYILQPFNPVELLTQIKRHSLNQVISGEN